MEKTGYEIIGMIKDNIAPERIRFGDYIYKFNSVINDYENEDSIQLDIIQLLNDEFEIIEEPKIWKPKEDEEYWFIDSFGNVLKDKWVNSFADRLRYDLGNCFKTEKEAQKVLEKITIYNQLKRYAEEHNTDNDNCTNIVLMNDAKLETYTDIDCKGIGIIYFTRKDLAEQAIKEIGEDNIKKLFE